MSQPVEPENPYATPVAFSPETQEEVSPSPQQLQPATGIAWFFLDAERRLRTLWRILLYVFLLGLLLTVLSIFQAIIAIVCYLLTLPPGESFSPRDFEQMIKESQVYFALPATLLLVAVTLPVTLAMRRYLDRRTMASMGFRTPPMGWPLSTAGGLLLGVGVMVMATFLAYKGGAFKIAEGSPGVTSLMWAGMLIFAAFFEEYVFRSYMLQNMIDAGRNGKNQVYFTTVGVIVSSILFWLAHSFNPGAWSTIWVGLNLFFAGIALSFCYMASRNVWFPTAVHFAWNCTQGLVLGVEVSGNPMPGLIKMERVDGGIMQLLNGGEFGLEGSPLGVLASLTICAVCGVMMWLRPSEPLQQV